jgi:hypothetical protein
MLFRLSMPRRMIRSPMSASRLFTVLPFAAQIIITFTLALLNRRNVPLWSPRGHRPSGDEALTPGASDSSREGPSASTAAEQSASDQASPALSNNQIITLTEDFERAIARQQESTLQVIKRHEQLIGDLLTLVRILQERVLIQQAQLAALGAPLPAEDRALDELIGRLPLGKVTFEQMLQLSGQLNERLYRPPFGSDSQ